MSGSHDDLEFPRTDVDRMVELLRNADPAQFKAELVDGLSDLELKRVLDAVPDRLLDIWWRRARES